MKLLSLSCLLILQIQTPALSKVSKLSDVGRRFCEKLKIPLKENSKHLEKIKEKREPAISILRQVLEKFEDEVKDRFDKFFRYVPHDFKSLAEEYREFYNGIILDKDLNLEEKRSFLVHINNYYQTQLNLAYGRESAYYARKIFGSYNNSRNKEKAGPRYKSLSNIKNKIFLIVDYLKVHLFKGEVYLKLESDHYRGGNGHDPKRGLVYFDLEVYIHLFTGQFKFEFQDDQKSDNFSYSKLISVYNKEIRELERIQRKGLPLVCRGKL